MKYAVYNPKNKPESELNVIYGFNNGGEPGFFIAQLISDDGYGMGSHMCSSEGFMPGDLGILEGRREDRHEGFRKTFPEGYRMEFVGSDVIDNHEGLKAALEKAKQISANSENAKDSKVEITFSKEDSDKPDVEHEVGKAEYNEER